MYIDLKPCLSFPADLQQDMCHFFGGKRAVLDYCLRAFHAGPDDQIQDSVLYGFIQKIPHF